MSLTMRDVEPGGSAMARDVGPLIRALRPALTEEGFARFAAEASAQGLVFTAAYGPDGRCLAVAGHRILATSRGRMLFVDDLVTDPAERSTGVGARLMAELEQRARQADCTRIELDSGVANTSAHRFYHSRRMGIIALHFALDLAARQS